MSSIHPRSEPTVRCCCPFVKTRRTVPAVGVAAVTASCSMSGGDAACGIETGLTDESGSMCRSGGWTVVSAAPVRPSG